jgi:hypothetical protein
MGTLDTSNHEEMFVSKEQHRSFDQRSNARHLARRGSM